MKYLEKLTGEQMNEFLQKKMEADTEINDIQDTFFSGGMSLEEADNRIREIHKKLKEWLESLNKTE